MPFLLNTLSVSSSVLNFKFDIWNIFFSPYIILPLSFLYLTLSLSPPPNLPLFFASLLSSSFSLLAYIIFFLKSLSFSFRAHIFPTIFTLFSFPSLVPSCFSPFFLPATSFSLLSNYFHFYILSPPLFQNSSDSPSLPRCSSLPHSLSLFVPFTFLYIAIYISLSSSFLIFCYFILSSSLFSISPSLSSSFPLQFLS